MEKKEKYVEICKNPFRPEFEKMVKEKIIPYSDKEHFSILMDQISEICTERTGWNSCDNILVLITQLKAELECVVEFNKTWKYQNGK